MSKLIYFTINSLATIHHILVASRSSVSISKIRFICKCFSSVTMNHQYQCHILNYKPYQYHHTLTSRLQPVVLASSGFLPVDFSLVQLHNRTIVLFLESLEMRKDIYSFFMSSITLSSTCVIPVSYLHQSLQLNYAIYSLAYQYHVFHHLQLVQQHMQVVNYNPVTFTTHNNISQLREYLINVCRTKMSMDKYSTLLNSFVKQSMEFFLSILTTFF